MVERGKIRSLHDYFIPLHDRDDRAVYFYRINGYTEEIGQFIRDYYKEARRTGVVIEGKIPNPDDANLAYYSEMMGMEFQLDLPFISRSLKKWLPRMSDIRCKDVSEALYASLAGLHRAGKTDNMIKNAYIKCMCWLYYKFERVVSRQGEEYAPKILYEGDISYYELMLIAILCHAGCDIVLLQHNGDRVYAAADPALQMSELLVIEDGEPFPEGYCLKQVADEIRQAEERERLYGDRSVALACVNAWMDGNLMKEICRPVPDRGEDGRFFYTCFGRVNGVEDKMTYVNDLLQLQRELRKIGRNVVVVDSPIEKPDPAEIAQIKRENYDTVSRMLAGLSENLNGIASQWLRDLIRTAFLDIVSGLQKDKQEEKQAISRLTGKAVYLLCWIRRYGPRLFPAWNTNRPREKESCDRRPDSIGCMVYMGGCREPIEAAFLRMLSGLPTDILILCPDLSRPCCLSDERLYEEHYEDSLSIERFPLDDGAAQLGTVAYHAERELDTLLYQDTGLYRARQYERADVICLRTMYEEIKILWDEEVKYRPGFDTSDGSAHIPVIFSKISGVKDADLPAYWNMVRGFMTEDTMTIRSAPFIAPTDPNPMREYAVQFYKNGRLQRQAIKNHPQYPYGIIREEIQDFILNKLEILLERKMIRGIGENGTEYKVIAQILNLPRDAIRLLQKFDFTKKNPKLIYINTAEEAISVEDSILTAFLHLAGFDILFFVPTGYRSVEIHFSESMPEEHQAGTFCYDLTVPELSRRAHGGLRMSWREKIFK